MILLSLLTYGTVRAKFAEGDVVDWHTHSVHSDGADLAVDVVRKAKQLGLKAIALTEHDQVI